MTGGEWHGVAWQKLGRQMARSCRRHLFISANSSRRISDNFARRPWHEAAVDKLTKEPPRPGATPLDASPTRGALLPTSARQVPCAGAALTPYV